MTRLFSRLSVRTKLFVTSLLVTLSAMFIVGVYSYAQQQQGIEFLGNRMLELMRTKSDDQLAARSVNEANQINQLLNEVDLDVSATADYMGRLYDRKDILGQSSYWDASAKLKPLALGQLDNPNDEPGSVLVPSRSPLTPPLAQELNTAKYLDFVAPNLLKENSDLVALYFVDPAGATLYYPNIDLATVVGDYDPSTRPYYTKATLENNPDKKTIWTAPYQDSAGTGLIVTISHPVYDSQGQFRGIVAADVQLAKISKAISTVKVGDSGYAFLIDPLGHVLGMREEGYSVFDLKPESVPAGETPQQTVLSQGAVELQDATDKMRRGGSGVTTFKAPNGTDYYIAYTKVPAANYSLGLIVPVNEMLGPTVATIAQLQNQTRLSAVAGLGLLALIGAVAAVVAYFAARTLTQPLLQLTDTAKEISGGNLEAVAVVTTTDEIGTLAATFNSMTAQLRDVINSLETRVEYRTAQIQASADVGRAAVSILDPDAMLAQAVRLITDRFGFYYAAAFLIDATGQWAVLHEASGPGEAVNLLKQSGHRLDMEGNSMVAAAIRRQRPNIAQQVGKETARFVNPLLPDTRAEVALPLIVGGEVLGALDVQSVQTDAFDEASTTTLQAMADQIAVALNNARQYRREQRRAQQTTRLVEATVELTTMAEEGNLSDRVVELMLTLLHAPSAALWTLAEHAEFLEVTQTNGADLTPLMGRRVRHNEGIVGEAYRSGYAVNQKRELAHQESWVNQAGVEVHAMLAVPLSWREQTVGVVTVIHTAENQTFTDDDVNIAQLFAAQAAAALENARLLNQVNATLEELGTVNKRLTGETWQTRTRSAHIVGEYRPETVEPEAAAVTELQVPIELRGQQIGLVTLADSRLQQDLTRDERSMVDNVVRQMALALESARLFEQTQSALGEARRLAQREQLVNRIVSKLRGAVSVDEVLSIATTEMRQAVRATYAAAQLVTPETEGNGEQH